MRVSRRGQWKLLNILTYLPTFQSYLLPPSSLYRIVDSIFKLLSRWRQEIRTKRSHQTMQHHVPEDCKGEFMEHWNMIAVATKLRARGKEETGFDSRERKIFFFPHCPDRLWGSSTLSIRYWEPFRQEENGRGVKLTTHFYLMTKLRMHGAIFPLQHTTKRKKQEERDKVYE
jgi:hypothetical protein